MCVCVWGGGGPLFLSSECVCVWGGGGGGPLFLSRMNFQQCVCVCVNIQYGHNN